MAILLIPLLVKWGAHISHFLCPHAVDYSVVDYPSVYNLAQQN